MVNKAVDIVIIPSEEVIDWIIKLNQSLSSREITLRRKDAMPHISIAMAVIDSAREEELITKFENLFR